MDLSKNAIDAVIQKVQTTLDGGARITLDLGYDAEAIVKLLLSKKMSGHDMIKVLFIDAG